MGEIQIIKFKEGMTKGYRYAILFKGRIVSRHRTLSNARKKYTKYLRIAKS